MDRTQHEEFSADLTNGNGHARLAAVKALAGLGTREAMELLVAALADDDDDVRFHAALALRDAPAKIQKKIIQLFGHKKWKVREQASKLLAEFSEPPVPTLIESLGRREDPNVTFWAIRTLGEIGDPRAVPGLVDVLHSGSSEEKIAATGAIARIEGRKSAKFLVETLTDDHWHVRKAAADALVAMGPSVVPEIVRMLDTDNRDLFHWAMKILTTLADAASVEPILALLARTHDNDRREVMVRALGEIGGARPVAALVELLSDESWTMRKCAAESLVRMGEAALDDVAARYATGNPDVRYWVVRIAGEVKSLRDGKPGRAADLVRSALDDAEWFVRSCAATAAGELGQVGAVTPLLRCMFDDNPEVRKNAALALERLAVPDAVPQLEEAARGGDPDVAGVALELLERIRNGDGN